MTSIIVAGSRDFTDKDFLSGKLDELISGIDGDIEIVSGHCRGADMLGEQYAKEHKIAMRVFIANWDEYGRAAGYIRNRHMAEYAAENNGILAAFPIGEYRGTMLMVKLAKQYGLKCNVFYAPKE